MSAESIYNKLRAAGMSHEGACGMLGNLQAESSLIANIAQRGMTNLSDEAYSTKFDTNPESCIKDGVGYGLAQWTFWSRKQGLSDFARARGVSVGNEDMQVDFAVHELRTEYSGLFSFLCSTDELYTATSRICKEYERPAVNNIARRYEFAQKWDKQFSDSDVGDDYVMDATKPETTPVGGAWFPPDLSIMVLQAVLVCNNYLVDVTGYKNADFLTKLRQFVRDIGG